VLELTCGRGAGLGVLKNDLEGIKAAAEETAGLAIAAQGIDVVSADFRTVVVGLDQANGEAKLTWFRV